MKTLEKEARKTPMSAFEKEVRKALIDMDKDLSWLANRAGISLAYLYDIFKGNRPGMSQKEKIISILGLNKSVLNRMEG